MNSVLSVLGSFFQRLPVDPVWVVPLLRPVEVPVPRLPVEVLVVVPRLPLLLPEVV